MRKTALALPPLLLLVGISARAQVMTNPVQDYINKTTILNNILSNRRATDMSQSAQTKRRTAGRDAGGAPARGGGASAAPEPTKFTPSGAHVLPGLLAEKIGGAAAQRREAERFFASLLGLYEQTARKDGFPANDLAYAFEYFVVNSYMTYHDLHDVPYDKDPRVRRGKDMFDRLTIINEKKLLKVTPSQERATYEQFAELLGSNPAVRGMTDTEKQTLTELLAIMFGVNYAQYMKGIEDGNEALTEQSRQVAKASLEKLTGLPIDRIKVGEAGLQP